MPYIKTIPLSDATGTLKEIYQSGAGPSAARGKVSMIRQASEDDINTMRSHGFDDRDILDIVYVICLYNFNDRMADAMGISGHDFLSG